MRSFGRTERPVLLPLGGAPIIDFIGRLVRYAARAGFQDLSSLNPGWDLDHSDDNWTGLPRCGGTDDVAPVAGARLLWSYAAPPKKRQYACQDRGGNEQRDRGHHGCRL